MSVGLGCHAKQDIGVTAWGLAKTCFEQEPMTERPKAERLTSPQTSRSAIRPIRPIRVEKKTVLVGTALQAEGMM